MNPFFKLLHNNRLILFIIATTIIIFGFNSYLSIPKELFPDIKLPTVNVTIILAGVSPEDAEKMIVLPIEKVFHSLDDVKKITAFTMNGMANISIQFNQNVDPNKASQDVRNKIQEARSDLPEDILEPIITEVDFSKLPVLSVAITNDNSEIALFKDAKFLKKRLELIPGVIEVDTVALRKEIVEAKINPAKWSKFGLTIDKISQMLTANNSLISLGNMVNNSDFSVKLSGLLRNDKEISKLPLSYNGSSVVTLGDVSEVKWGLEEETTFGRVNYKPGVILQISKKVAVNTIEIISKVKKEIAKNSQYLNVNSDVVVMLDGSQKVQTRLHDLINNIVFAIILVMAVIILQIGFRQGLVVGLSIPLSFYAGIIVLKMMGYTANTVVLFALIMVIGMIVDATIIVTEDADWRMHRGIEPIEAYMEAAQRMSIPVLSATVGIIVVFMPLLFWPGVVGQFIKYIPITLITVLTASIFVAMILVPVIGGEFCQKYGFKDNLKPTSFLIKARQWIEDISDAYIRKLDKILEYPKRIPFILPFVLIATIITYKFLGYGTEFFPGLEPEVIEVQLRAQGNFSPERKLFIAKQAEKIIEKYETELKSVYSNVNPQLRTVQDTNDSVAVITLEYEDWDKRRPSKQIIASLRKDLAVISGINVNIIPKKEGPAAGKYDIEIDLFYENTSHMKQALKELLDYLNADNQYSDVLDTDSSGRVEWNLELNREVATREDVSLKQVGGLMRMLTVGIPVGKVTIDNSDEKLDLILKYPKEYRTITNLQDLIINNNQGKPIAIGNLITTKMGKEVSKINRINYDRAIIIGANVKEGVVINNKVAEIQNWISSHNYSKDIRLVIAGDQDDQAETANFLKTAFGVAILIKAIILIVQFNSVYYTLVVLSAVVLSIIGVLWGLMLMGKSFCIVMCGLGIVALAGIVVSNNIILIDTYQRLIEEGIETKKAILQACRRRLRPIILTSMTTTIGLIPMMFNINIDFINIGLEIGSPSGLWWEHLSITIASGLIVTTLLTLFFTPCLLMIHTPKHKYQD